MSKPDKPHMPNRRRSRKKKPDGDPTRREPKPRRKDQDPFRRRTKPKLAEEAELDFDCTDTGCQGCDEPGEQE